MTARDIELAMIDGYEAIFTDGMAVHQGTIEAHMMLLDTAGSDGRYDEPASVLSPRAAPMHRSTNWVDLIARAILAARKWE